MKTSRIVLLKDQIGYGIYDTVEESFVGLLQKRGEGIDLEICYEDTYDVSN